MKLNFDHFSLCYPRALEITIKVEAETDFERDYLRAMSRDTRIIETRYVYPTGDKGAIQIVMNLKEPQEKI